MTSSSIVAKCYLKRDNDENNVCLLTESTLVIRYKGKSDHYFIHWVKNIAFKRRIFLIPIVFGGISASLAGIGLFQYFLNPWIMLSILFTSALAIYYGIQGSMALVIITPIKEYDYFISHVSENLRAFSAFAYNQSMGNQIDFYLIMTQNEYTETQANGFFLPLKAGIPLSTVKPSVSENEVILKVKTEELPFEIKYIKTETGDLTPYIFDKIPISHLKEA